MRKNFNEFYKSNDYLKFQKFISNEYHIELIVTEFSSHLIKKTKDMVEELTFDVNFDLDKYLECSNIITCCELFKFIGETSNVNDNKTIPYSRIVKKGMFGLKKETGKATYNKRSSRTYTFDTAVHDMVLNTYREYPA